MMREFGTFPVFAVNVTEVAPAATVTVLGKAMRLLPEDTAIVLPPAGAALFSVITQLLLL
jgi:threonine dehydratase